MKTINLKTIVVIATILLTISCNAYSQSSIDRNYFKENILELDPIEGEFYVEAFGQLENAFITYPESKLMDQTWTIVKKNNGKYTIREFDGERPSYIERIGETNAYNYCQYWSAVGWVKSRFYMKNTDQFEIIYEVPIEQIKSDMGRDYMAHRATYRLNAIKNYPTSSMYRVAMEEAIRIEQEQKRQREIEESKPKEWSGSGFALNNGYLVTNYHVVEDAGRIVVKGIKGDFSNTFNADVVATDKYNDLALLKINDSRFTGFGTIPYKVKTNTSDVGEEIFVLGYPLTSTMGDEIKLTTGVISSKTGFQGDVSLYQISAPVQPGNSGGPLFDSKGNLIGIVNSKHTGAESVGYAIKASYLSILVESSVSSSILPSNNTISSQPLTGKVKAVKNYVFMIECSK